MTQGTRIAAAICSSALALAACGNSDIAEVSAASASPRSPWVAPSYQPLDAADACPDQEREHLPTDLGPVRQVFLCLDEVRSVPGEGQWTFRVVRGVTAGVDRLLAAYAPADIEPGDGPCAGELPGPLVIYLQTDRIRAVRAPLGVCGKPTQEAQAAFFALGSRELSATRTGQSQSQLSIDTECSDGWKDMLTFDDAPSQQSPHPQSVAVGSRVCIYSVRADVEGDRIGHLTSAHALTADQVDAINTALTHVVLDASCSRHEHSRFALLWDGRQAVTYVALDGCAVMQDGVGWWRAGDDLRAAVN